MKWLFSPLLRIVALLRFTWKAKAVSKDPVLNTTEKLAHITSAREKYSARLRDLG